MIQINNHKAIIVIFVGVLLSFISVANAGTYYVDVDITDTNAASVTPDCTNYNPATFLCSGGTDSAYKSIADLNAKTFSPGDYIYFKRGEIWYLDTDNIALTFLGSGEAGNPITIDAFGSGDKPILTGETPTALTGWTQVSLTSTYYKDIGFDPNRIVTYTRNSSTTALKLNEGAEMNVGPFEWDLATGNRLYVNVGEDPGNGVIKTSRTAYPVKFIGNNYVTIKNIGVQYSTTHGFYAYSGAGNLIFDGITAKWNGLDGLDLVGTASTTIQNSLITYNGRDGMYALDGSTNLLITNNEFSYNGLLGIGGDKDGIGLGGEIAQNNSGIISYNNIHHNYAHGVALFLSSNVIVEHNTLTDNFYTNPSILGDIYFGYGTGDIARYNYVSSPIAIGFQGVGISGYSNPSAYFNVINCTSASGNSGIYADQTPVNVGNILITNNTIYGCDTGIYTHATFGGGTVTSKNNIAVVDGATDEAVEYRKIDMVTSDYNLFNTSLGDSSRLAVWGATGYNQNQWSNYRTASGQDANSLTPADPVLIAPSNANFSPLATSSVIDAGTTGSWITSTTTDYAGNPIYGTPDIGAYEYQPPYSLGTDEVQTTGNIRIYGDRKFRYTSATSSSVSADFNVTPAEGSWTYTASTTRPEWLNVSITTWNTSGTYSKLWTASSTSATTTIYMIGDMSTNAYYDIAVDGTSTTTLQANSSGRITYTYTGGYSAHTFTVDPVTSDSTPPILSSGSPSGTLSAGTTATTLSVSTDESSICKFGTTSGIAYDSIASTFTTTGGTSHSESITGLSAGSYAYYIRCTDGSSPNISDYTISFSVASASSGGGGGSSSGGGSSYVAPVTTLVSTATTTGSTATTTACTRFTYPTFMTNISPNMVGNDVINLQKILFLEKIISTSTTTGIYDATTTKAVQSFQIKYNIASYGTPYTTGFGNVGPRTRTYLNQLLVQGRYPSLKQCILTAPIATPLKYIFTRNLKFGSTGEDVRQLQKFLNSKGFIISTVGSGSLGNETMYFGPATTKTLAKFQFAHNITPAVGFFGPITMKKVNEM